MLTLDILGSTQLRRDGAAIVLGVKKALALLVLLGRSGALPRARVVALLWPELDEPSGRRNLRRELARLREAGAGEVLHVEGDTLALAATVACDAHAFAAALAAGQPDAALGHWRGPPADGLTLDYAAAFDDWLAAERVQLHDARRRALEASAATHEAQGRLAQALQRVEQLLDDDPLQEQRHQDAMRLLAALGRREAALAQFERCRVLLEQELGLTPMAETLALLASLRVASSPIANAPSTCHVAPAPAPAALLPTQLPFVGRGAEVVLMEAAWAAGRALLIEGDAGVGKSRLAIEFAAAHGPYALVRCRAGDRELPYAAFSRGLRSLMGEDATLAELPPWVRSELARLLPELGAPPSPLRTDAEQGRFLEACAQAWLRLTSDSFDAVIVDDWHHADAASRALLALVAQRRREGSQDGTGARELLVYRSELDAEAAQAMQRFRERVDVQHLVLQALPADAVLELVQRLSGAPNPTRFAARLCQATGANPFFLAETLRHLAEQHLLEASADGSWRTPFDEATQDYRELPVPASVFEAVLARVQRLPAAAARVLEAAALAAEPFAPSLLAPACALSELDTVLAIEQAVQVHLLREHEMGGYAFAHDLVRQALDTALTPTRRNLVHRRLALGAEAAGAPPATVALHHEACGEAARAVGHRMAAGDAAQRVHALSEALGHWQQALRNQPTPGQALALHLRLARTARTLNQREIAMVHAAELQALAAGPLLSIHERAQALTEAARSLVGCNLAAQGMALLDGLSMAMNERQQAQVMAVRIDALRRLGRVDDAMARARMALAMPGMQGEDRAALLLTLAQADHVAGNSGAALAHIDQALALCRELADQHGVVRALYLRGTVKHDAGDPSAAEAELTHAIQSAARFGFVGIQRVALYALGHLYLEQTQCARARELAHQGWTLQPAMTTRDMRAMYRTIFIGAHLGLGEWGQAYAHLPPALDEALGANEPALVAHVAISSLELLALLGEQQRVQALLRAIGDQTLRQMKAVAHELALARVKFELLSGDLEAAALTLAPLRGATETDNARTRLWLGLLRAELALGAGDGELALALLPDHDGPGMSDELRLRGLALQVGVEALSGALRTATQTGAQAALGSDTAHAVAALYLHRALAAAHHAGVAGAPATAAQDHAAHVQRLAASLQAHPQQRAAFLRAAAP